MPTSAAGAEHGVAERHRGEQDHERRVAPSASATQRCRSSRAARPARPRRPSARRRLAAGRGGPVQVEHVEADQHGGVEQVERARTARRASTTARRARASTSSIRCGSGSASRPSAGRLRAGSSATAAGSATAQPSSRRLAPVRLAVDVLGLAGEREVHLDDELGQDRDEGDRRDDERRARRRPAPPRTPRRAGRLRRRRWRRRRGPGPDRGRPTRSGAPAGRARCSRR